METQCVGNFIDIALKQTNVNRIIWKHTKFKNKLDHVSAAMCTYSAYPTAGATCREASLFAASLEEIESCRDVLWSFSPSRIQSQAHHGNNGTVHVITANNYVHLAGICDEGFNTLVKKKRKHGDLPNLRKHKNRPATIVRYKELLDLPCNIQEI